MAEVARLPMSPSREPKPGDLYSPDIGEHAGHVVEVQSTDGVRFNILGTPLPSILVRCLDDRQSWAFADPWKTS